jgi:predicted metalloprotease with PDZ domain
MKSTLLRAALLVFLFLSLGVRPQAHAFAQESAPLEYTVSLNDRTGDTFKVTLSVDDLSPENAVYQFASTAPGTYQTMNIGRFVRSFEAVDAEGRVIPSENVSTNQWRISDPERVTVIRYTVAETWDTPVDQDPIYLMAGTSIEDDHVLINGQAVFGYPTGMQARPLRIQLVYPANWRVGTALDADETGALRADDYDHVVDSPILMGRLSLASLDVRGSAVEVYTYSKTDKVKSDQILDAVTDILNAAGDFLIELPVERYVFLFHFEDASMGAWEHSYSSEYVFAESDFDAAIAENIPSIVAHEFFHVVTPLNIHSEIIEYFNFVEPVASEHIWLYEGTTEWASDIMQLRSGLIDLENYLGRLHRRPVRQNLQPERSESQFVLGQGPAELGQYL